MASSVAFEWLCDQLETATSMTRLESRGTVRLSLKAAGLDPGTVTQRELEVVLERVLPRELESRNIEGWNGICEELARRLETAKLMEPQAAERPESVFARLER
jgi:hypothetical protein